MDGRRRLRSGMRRAFFYYCLKRTGDSMQAEDLSQDILRNVLQSLHNGAAPDDFSAWVWRIAHNRYAAWAKAKRRQRETAADCDDVAEIADPAATPEERLLDGERFSLLRREMAFIRSDYRDIVVAYYVEDRSVREIAASLSLTESTVKQRLHRARESLKEGMGMAREFGARSYRPENIAFCMNGMTGADGEPWNYLSRLLCKNLLLAAYRMPATAQELAVEVGVALPYLEEELQNLVAATLMKQKGDRYETNLFIVSNEAQRQIYDDLRALTPALTDAVLDALRYEIAWKNENCPGWHEGFQPDEDMLWALLMRETDAIEALAQKPFPPDDDPRLGAWGHTVRPNGGEWDILGMEVYTGEKPAFVGLHGCTSTPADRRLPEIEFRQYKFQYGGIERQTPVTLPYAEAQALVRLVRGERSEDDAKLLESLAQSGYLRQRGDGFEPTILVMRRERQGEMPPDARARLDRLRQKAGALMTRHYRFCRTQIYKEIPASLKDDPHQIHHACRNVAAFRGAILEEALRRGVLHYDGDSGRMLGAFLVV